MIRYLILISLFLFACHSREGKVRVAIASSFHPAFKEIKKLYDSTHENQMDLIIASSGQIVNQVIHGAPFDVFVSADEKYYTKIKDKLPIKREYLKGLLALASNDSIKNTDSLLENKFLPIALPNSKVAPYGVLAENFLKGKMLKINMIKGESVSHVNQFLTSGSVAAALTSYSSVKNTNFNRVVFDEYFLTNYLFVAENDKSKDLIVFLQSEEVVNILFNYGFKK